MTKIKGLIGGIMLLAAACVATPAANAGVHENAVQGVISKLMPQNAGYKLPTVKKVAINKKKKTITVDCSESLAYIPLTSGQVELLKADCLGALGDAYSKYLINIKTDGQALENLAIDLNRMMVVPTETHRFITPLDGIEAPKGLDGANIALWQSHGRYYKHGTQMWEWQRVRLFEQVEDLFTQSYVMPYLMPMLQNAGAYVMSPRERDICKDEYIIDNDHKDHNATYHEHKGEHAWAKAPEAGFKYDKKFLGDGENPFKAGTARQVKAVKAGGKESKAQWNANIERDGEYAIYVSYQSLPISATDAVYTINAANGQHRFKVNQQMGGGTWVYLGHFPLEEGESDKPIVELSNASADKDAVVTADAVKIGGGMGNVARGSGDAEYATSGYPRFTEGARYWLQWAGAPESVYNENEGANDYKDDYCSRPNWVNWLAGGSSVLPEENGLKIPIDLAFAMHSDAGISKTDSIIGTLGIYCTDEQKQYSNGTARLSARDLTNLVMTNVTEDIRRQFEPTWTRRGMWDKSYAEARRPQVPTMLLELLSHQNFMDMRYGTDPSFRFTVARAIYKGMLQFLARRDGREYAVQPLAVSAFAINKGEGNHYMLTWQPTKDKFEPTAMPTYYIVEERGEGCKGFRRLAVVEEPYYELNIDDDAIHSYRIVAGNDGGVSFPSEVLALRHEPSKPTILIVNGFTRVSAPDTFAEGDMAGFDNAKDSGVPYIRDISYIGDQYEFRRDIPWKDDEISGFGASRSNYETEVIAGNTFDYPAVHGAAIAEAGYGFVSMSADAFAANDSLQGYAVVDLILGKQKEIKIGYGAYGTRYKTFPEALKSRLTQYAKAGGNMFVSGCYIGSDLWCNPYSSGSVASSDQRFAQDILGYKWRAERATVTDKLVEPKTKLKGFTGGKFEFVNDLNPDFYAVQSPDALALAGKSSSTIMRYDENHLVAGTAYDAKTHRSVALGVPFEIIKGADQRAKLMTQILNYLNAKL